MARPCTVCSHSKRAEIDAALVNGTAIRDVAGQHDLRKSAVDRHRSHIGTLLAEAGQRRAELELDHGDDLLSQAKTLTRDLSIALEEAKQSKSLGAYLQVTDRMQRQLALQAQLLTLAEQGGAGQRRYVMRWLDHDAPAPELPKPEPAALPELPESATTH